MDAKKFRFKQKEIIIVNYLMNFKRLGIGLLIILINGLVLWSIFQPEQSKEETQQHPGWMEFYLDLRSGGTGIIPEGLVASWYKADKLNGLRFKKAENSLINIKEIGPFNVGGRTRSVIIDYSNPNRLLTAGISGGIWISENNGQNWKIVNDTAPTLSATSITQSPFNTDYFYYGTGEAMGNSADIGGLGLFRSTDGGKTFEHLAYTMTTPLSKIWDVKHSLVLDSTIYVATDGGGLWRSKNAGESFERIYSTGRKIHEIKVFEDSTIIIAEAGAGLVKINENDLYNIKLNNTNWPTNGYSRIAFDYCKSYPNVIYAQLANTSNTDIVKSLKTSDGGLTWQETSLPTRGRYDWAWYCFNISVCPIDSNFVFSGSVSAVYTRNGGTTWFEAGESHADYHTVAWYPNGIEFLVGNDGGVYKYNTQNLNLLEDLNNGLNITQFYAGHYAPSGSSLIGGTQDNGTQLSFNGAPSFARVYGGDGSFCYINQQDESIRYVSWQNLNMYRQEAGFSYPISTYIKSAIGGDSYTWFINPYTMNPLDGDQLYVPTKRQVYRSLNGGQNWIALTGDLLGDSYAVGLSNSENPIAYIGGTASRLFRVKNAATAGSGEEVDMFNTKVTNFLGSTIGCIEVDPNDEETIYCGLVNISTRSRIWKITNADTDNPEWYDIGNNLPTQMAVNWIEVDPQNSDHIYLATDYGLYSSLNGGASWQKEYRIPNVPIDQIRLRESDRKLFIFTHGRGSFTADLLQNPVASIKKTTEELFNVYPNPASSYIIINADEFSSCSLYNSEGKKMLKTSEKRINLTQFQEGIYFAEIETKKGKSIKKIIVSR